jgi:hypothetical protein
MRLDPQRVSEDVARAETEDLLDRATVYREGMEPEALRLVDAELGRRGFGPAELEAHAESRRSTMLTGPDGLPVQCERCRRPAVVEVWDWQRLWKLVPIFPRRMRYCQEHRPPRSAAE